MYVIENELTIYSFIKLPNNNFFLDCEKNASVSSTFFLNYFEVWSIFTFTVALLKSNSVTYFVFIWVVSYLQSTKLIRVIDCSNKKMNMIEIKKTRQKADQWTIVFEFMLLTTYNRSTKQIREINQAFLTRFVR